MLQGSNIYLKEIEVEDAEFLYCLFQHKEYSDMFYEGSTTIIDWKNRIKNTKEDTRNNQFTIRLRKNDVTIGWLGFFEEKDEKDIECMQILIIDIYYLRHGYGTEIMNILKKALFDNGKKKIKLWTQESNIRAQSFYLKNGFSIMGTEVEEVDGGRKLEKFVIMECTL